MEIKTLKDLRDFLNSCTDEQLNSSAAVRGIDDEGQYNITGAKPQEIADMLLVYKDGVRVPLHHFFDIMKCMPKNQHHLFAVAVKNDTVYIEYAESKNRL